MDEPASTRIILRLAHLRSNTSGEWGGQLVRLCLWPIAIVPGKAPAFRVAQRRDE
jgi:hypothetical protein